MITTGITNNKNDNNNINQWGRCKSNEFRQIVKKVRPGTFGKTNVGLTGVPKKPLSDLRMSRSFAWTEIIKTRLTVFNKQSTNNKNE